MTSLIPTLTILSLSAIVCQEKFSSDLLSDNLQVRNGNMAKYHIMGAGFVSLPTVVVVV